jgi:glutamate/tyrosine decarboxylase-like PLP-dependent enzyme
MSDELAPYFLGAYGENNDFFEKTLTELLRDHVYWRRNFHPEDTPPISTREQYEPAFLDGLARTRHELHQLTAQLKRSVPFFHPRYLGHMCSDLLMPGLIAQLVTTLYNPNNIVEEVAPVTLELELQVGLQLSRMVGYAVEPSVRPCALGHLTSGGTLANDESLWLARAVKLYPLAVRDACARLDLWPEPSLKEADDFSLLNWSTAQVLALAEKVGRFTGGDALRVEVSESRVETVGLARFTLAHPLVAELVVLAPATAHYSWQKAMKLLGLGSAQLLEIPTVQARLDVSALKAMLAERAEQKLPVLAVIGVYGTTEFGTLDPLHELAALQGQPLHYWLHVDAAWGGYIPSLFRDQHGGLRSREEIASEFKYFPSERVYRSTEGLARADSITVDPHKLGFVPFGAGAFLAKDRRVFDLVLQDASYVFTSKDESEAAHYRKVGRFSLEGSKPGAAAAACYVNHRVLPLDGAGFGRLIARSVHTCERLFDKLTALAPVIAAHAKLCVPFEPDCNLVCLSLNPAGNRSLATANAYGRKLYETLSMRADVPLQARSFFGSCTTVALSHLGEPELERIGVELGLDLKGADDTGLFMLRHTLMNPWLLSPQGHDSPTHVEAYADYLAELVTTRA